MPQDSPTRFKGKPGVAKRVAWAEPLPLDDIKTVARALGRVDQRRAAFVRRRRAVRYLARKGDATEGVMIRALVPVNLRPLEEAYRLGNQFGLVFLELPIGIANPVERLYAVRANMTALKGSYQPVIALGLLAAMGAGPKVLQEELLQALARNGTAVMTNVPGPPQPLYFAGAAIDRFLFWVPQSGDIGMGVSILSYAGQVQFGLITDRGLCPDPDRDHRRVRPRVREAAARDPARAVAARGRSRSGRRGEGGRRGSEGGARQSPGPTAEGSASRHAYSSSERASSTSRRSIASAGFIAAASW